MRRLTTMVVMGTAELRPHASQATTRPLRPGDEWPSPHRLVAPLAHASRASARLVASPLTLEAAAHSDAVAAAVRGAACSSTGLARRIAARPDGRATLRVCAPTPGSHAAGCRFTWPRA